MSINRWIGTGRLTKDPDVRTNKDTTVARFTVAVDRRFKKEGQDNADFISCVAFGKNAEFMDKYFSKGMKAEIEGRIQTGSYEKDGVKHYTTDIICDTIGFAESKKSQESKLDNVDDDGFMNVADGVDADMPFA